MNLWRVLIPTVLGFLVITFFCASSFLSMVKAGVDAQGTFTSQGGESAEAAALAASSTAFNQSVALAANAESQINKNYEMIGEINNVAAANGVSVNNISFQAASAPILVAGTAPSTNQIAAFKSAIQSDPHFGTVTLPVLNIQQDGQGGYSFSMSFPLSATGF